MNRRTPNVSMTRLSSSNKLAEKTFYLDEFRGQTLAFAVPADSLKRVSDAAPLIRACVDLLKNDSRLLLVCETGRNSERFLSNLRKGLGTAEEREQLRVLLPPARGARLTPVFLRQVWTQLRKGSTAVVGIGAEPETLADFAQRLVVRLGGRKLVLVDAEGGIANEAGLVSFMDGAMLEELLRRGEAEWAGVGHRRPVLEAVNAALRGGVDSVNVCSLGGVECELFTYEGAGTLFTLEDYCRIERLRVDDFLEVERLLKRGQSEGYLRPRSSRETAEILMSGYGATIGSGHLAGVCALATDPYRRDRAGEIAGLYTITRFKGEGVGTRLLARALEDARHLGLRYVFACTMHDRAAAFFERNGFRRVSAGEVPSGKWRSYPPDRRGRVRAFKFELAPS